MKRRYEVLLSVNVKIGTSLHHIEADGIGYAGTGPSAMVILFVLDDVEGEKVERHVFALPSGMVAYVKEIMQTEAEEQAADRRKRLDAIADLEPVHFRGGEVVRVDADGDYLLREQVLDLAWEE